MEILQELNVATRSAIQEQAIGNYPEESCGIIVGDQVIPFRNLAEDPTRDFILDPTAWAKYKKVDCVWHSHINDTDLSFADIRSAKQLRVPIYLFSLPTGKEYLYNPLATPPLLGRQFVYWAADCWELVRDWYKINREVELTDHPRELQNADGLYDWDTPGWDVYREMLPIHFDRYPADAPIERGDLVLSTIRWQSPPGAPSTPNHVAIVDDAEKSEILQHLFGRLSERSVYGAEGRRATESIWKFRN
jgi:proteasome lid subunit RPN8/RPN11